MTTIAAHNLRLFAWFVPLYNCHFWLALWFLFFNSALTISDVLLLEAVYYVTVVLLEVPSGYLSDRWGRVPTLRLSALASLASFALFAFAEPGFAVYALAQALWAASYACYSGTDAAFHLDTLESADRAAQFDARQAKLNRNMMFARGSGALGGGVLAVFGLIYAYYVAVAIAAVVAVIAFSFTSEHQPRPPAILRHLAICAEHLRTPIVAWLFGYAVLQTILVHIPYEFSQPYLAAALGEDRADLTHTPWLSGILIAAIAWIGAIAAAYSIDIRQRFGLQSTLIGLTAAQVALIGVMAFVIHPVVLPLLALRGVHAAIGGILVVTDITPRIGRGQRATYLSLQSSAGRLGFALTLALLAFAAADLPQRDGLTAALMTSFALAVIGLVALTALRPKPE